MIINYSRNNRKKYFFQGRETTKIEDTNSSATERSREPQPKEKTSKNGCHMTRNLVLTYQRSKSCSLHLLPAWTNNFPLFSAWLRLQSSVNYAFTQSYTKLSFTILLASRVYASKPYSTLQHASILLINLKNLFQQLQTNYQIQTTTCPKTTISNSTLKKKRHFSVTTSAHVWLHIQELQCMLTSLMWQLLIK